jgi:thymidylate synthase ThyX
MQEKVEEYNKLVDNRPVDGTREEIAEYADLLKEKYLEILYTNPAGFELTARLTTNYRCLLNIYIQRHDHRLPEWREFCTQLLEELPYFKEIVEAYLSKEEN